MTSLFLANTPVVFHHLANAAKTSCCCVQKTGGLGNGISSALQLSKNNKEINSESHMLMKICKWIKYLPCWSYDDYGVFCDKACSGGSWGIAEAWPVLLHVWGGRLAWGRMCRGVTRPALPMQEVRVFKKLPLIYRETFMLLCLRMTGMCLLFLLPGRVRAVEIPELQVAKNGCWGAILGGLLHIFSVDLTEPRFPRQDAKALNSLMSIYLSVGMMGDSHLFNRKGEGICILLLRCLQTSFISIEVWNT